MHPMLTIAVRAARKAGHVIARGFSELDLVKVESKADNDFVTNIDKEAEKAIIGTILQSYPDHSFIGEEGGHQAGKNPDYCWVIDPLDGTTNFARGVPHFAVSIALRVKGKTEVAVVYDPIRDELFSAVRGSGAQLNGYRIRVQNKKELAGTLLATGFPFKAKHLYDAYMATFTALFKAGGDVRRAGAAALDLAYLAAGRLDVFWELGLKPWDTAAGDLLVREAGGMVSDLTGGHGYFDSGNIVAANPKLLAITLKEIKPFLTEELKK
ncbi:inositol-1-monophosphatase [Catenovulum agarivorans DS-2]|uniref:Inositol-1-monophosphatase n=1 Tax=Catenovulum agarivorans DS-2 TaxID=1328313 RepID=W7QLZ4_9ALTE|nr:inositol-1-monophosphatase [Catenovulum agarivorans]EWH09982.1 inositol-1-monophosphatase [Catenovulum agarivorans DS-2]